MKLFKRVLLAVTLLLTLGVLVACETEPEVPEQPEDSIPLVPLEPSTPEEDIITFIMKEVESTEGRALQTSASKIKFNDVYEIVFKDTTGTKEIKGRADGFALASGNGTPLKGEFILKADKKNKSFLELDLEEDIVIELDLHMWYTATNTQWLEELFLNGELLITGVEELSSAVKTYTIELKAGTNRFEYVHTLGQYASQLVFKEIRIK